MYGILIKSKVSDMFDTVESSYNDYQYCGKTFKMVAKLW